METKKSLKNTSVIWAAVAVAAVIFGFLFGQMSVFQSKANNDAKYILYFYSDLDGDYSTWENELGNDLISKQSLSTRSQVMGISESTKKITGFVIFIADSFEDAVNIASTHPEKDEGIELRAISDKN